MLEKKNTNGEEDRPAVNKEDILAKAPSAYEAIVAIAKEARRLKAAGGIYLEEGEKAIPRAVENFVGGKVEYEIEGDLTAKKKGRKKGKKRK